MCVARMCAGKVSASFAAGKLSNYKAVAIKRSNKLCTLHTYTILYAHYTTYCYFIFRNLTHYGSVLRMSNYRILLHLFHFPLAHGMLYLYCMLYNFP